MDANVSKKPIFESTNVRWNGFPYKCVRFSKNKEQIYSTEPHYHDNIEMIFINEGNFNVFIDKKCYKMAAGDMIIINSRLPHNTYALTNESFKASMIKFDPSVIFSSIADPHECIYLRRIVNNTNYFRAREISNLSLDIYFNDAICEFTQKKFAFEISIKYSIYMILLPILRAEGNDCLPEISRVGLAKLCYALNYIEENFEKNISLSNVAEVCNSDYIYLSKMFGRILGVTFIKFLNNTRLREAEKLLLTTQLSIADIAKHTGYNYESYFVKKFKEAKKITPYKFRCSFKENIMYEFDIKGKCNPINNKPIYEPFNVASNSNPFKCARSSSIRKVPYKTGYHWHVNIEMLYLISGNLHVYTGSSTYDMLPGNFIVINSCEPHYTYNLHGESYDYIVIKFTPGILQTIVADHYELRFLLPLIQANSYVKRCFNATELDSTEIPNTIMSIYNECKEKRVAYEIAVRSGICKLYLEMFRKISASKTIDFSEEYFNRFKTESGNRLINEPVEYIMNNYSNDLNMKDVAFRFNINYYYFSKLFKNYTGQGFSEFLNSYRIMQAEKLMFTSNMKINEIAYHCGYSSDIIFVKTFKRYKGQSPKKYIKTMKLIKNY